MARSWLWPFSVFATLVVAAFNESTVTAGDRLSVDKLAARSEAAVIVKVRLGKGKVADQIVIHEILAGLPAGATAPTTWLNHCVPSRAELKRWIAGGPAWKNEWRMWKQALAGRPFESLVFLRTFEGQQEPSCETEAMLMKHTTLHPNYARYVAEARGAVARHLLRPTRQLPDHDAAKAQQAPRKNQEFPIGP